MFDFSIRNHERGAGKCVTFCPSSQPMRERILDVRKGTRTTGEQDADGPQTGNVQHTVDAGGATFHFTVPGISADNVQVISADDVVVEDSQTLKYLRLRNGDYRCYKSVFLVL